MVSPGTLAAEIRDFRLLPGLFDAAPARVEEVETAGIRVPRITNELWTRRQRQGHSLHEVSYRACFKAELPRFFISRLTREGDAVFDPFMGRGTTLLEAALLGRVPMGNDVNPLAPILIEPRLDPPEPADVEARLDEMFACAEDPGPAEDEPDLTVFYHPETLRGLRAIRRWFLDRAQAGADDRCDRWLRMVATNRLTGHSPGFFSGRTMPPNQAVSIATQRKINERLGVRPPRRNLRAILSRKSLLLLRSGVDRARLGALRAKGRITVGDAARLGGIADSSVRCTVTSPPFLDVVDYAKDNWLRCWFNGLEAGEVAAGLTTSRRLEDWCGFLAGAFAELFRVTEPGGWVVFEVGEVRRGKILLEEPVLPVARDAGFRPVAVVVHEQEFTKTANCWGVANNRKGTNTNRLVLLYKEPGAETG